MEQIKMNMISTGAFLTEMDASDKQKNSLVNKLVSAWEQKNSKTARAGGASLMALSLAACGSSDDDAAVSYTQGQLDAAKVDAAAAATTVAETAAATAQTAAVDAALTHTDGTKYSTVDAAKTAGVNMSSSDAIAAALKGSDGTAHATVDAAVTSNDASITTAATTAALKGTDGTAYASVDAAVTSNDAAIATAQEATLLTGTGFATVAALNTAYVNATTFSAQSFTLTTGADVTGTLASAAGSTSTDGDDSYTATNLTYTTSDAIVGGKGSDSLTVNSAVKGITATPTVVGVETITFNISSGDLGAAAVSMTNISGGTVTINQTKAGAAATAALTNVGNVTTVFGSGITSTTTVGMTGGVETVMQSGLSTGITVTGGTTGKATVTGAAALTAADVTMTTGTATVTGGSAFATIDVDAATMNVTTTSDSSTITLTGTGAADVATVSIGKAASIVGAAAVETVNLSAGTKAGDGTQTAASVGTFSSNAATTYNLTGANDIVLAGSEVTFDGKTVNTTATGSAQLKLTTVSTSDLDGVATGVTINLNHVDALGAIDATLTVKNNATVLISADLDNLNDSTDATLTIDSTELASGSETLNLTFTASKTDKTEGVTVSDFETVNLSTTGATAAVSLAPLTAGTTSAITLASGSKGITFGTVTGKTFDATGYTGAITMTTNDANLTTSATFGGGNDAITLTTADAIIVDGGAGTDTLNLKAASAAAGLKISNFEVLTIIDGDTAVKASLLDGATFSVKGTNGTNDNIDIKGTAHFDSTSLDLSGLTFDANATGFDLAITSTSVAASIALGSDFTVTGSSIIDTLAAGTVTGKMTVSSGAGADVIATGNKVDTITLGEGIDSIDAGAGNDIIDVSETTSAVDTINYTTATDGMDTITGFANGTDIFDTTFAGVGITLAASGTLADVATAAGGVALATDADVTFEVTGSLRNAITDYTAGAQVLAAVSGTSTLTVHTEADHAVLIIYDGGNAYAYEIDDNSGTDGGGTGVLAADITLFATFNDITAGAFTLPDIA
jgi:hypothetical protein